MLDYSYKSILRMALPLMASTFIQAVVMITDSAFLSRYNTFAFDAAGNGGLIYITLFVMLSGFNDGTQILIARRIGENRLIEIPRIFGSAVFLNIISALLLFMVADFVLPGIIMRFAKHPEIASGQVLFLSIRSVGLFFAVATLAINAYFMACGRTTLVLLAALITAGANIILDYAFIFGKFSFPKMGIEGAALASVLAEGIGMSFLIISFYFSKEQRKMRVISGVRASVQSIKSLFLLGLPISFQGLVALSTWTVFFFWIEQLGEYELTISQTIRSLYFLAFVPIWGFAVTTKTYVSQYMGSGDFGKIKIIQRRIQIMTLIGLFIIMHGAFFYPEHIVGIINPDPHYIRGSAEILRFIAASIFIYGFVQVYFNTISGSGNTRFTFLVELIAVILYLTSAYLFIHIFEWSIKWVWFVEYIYFLTMGITAMAYLRFFNWKKKKL